MKRQIKVIMLMCALVLGTALTASAQGRYRARHGRSVTVYPNGSRVYRRPNGRTVYRNPNGRSVVVLPNGRSIVRSSRSRQSYPQVSRARTFRLPNGRLVTVLPNGRRIYH